MKWFVIIFFASWHPDGTQDIFVFQEPAYNEYSVCRQTLVNPDEIAKSIENAEAQLGEGRVKYIHPDCGFWMLKRSVADRKIAALAKGRDLYLGI